MVLLISLSLLIKFEYWLSLELRVGSLISLFFEVTFSFMKLIFLYLINKSILILNKNDKPLSYKDLRKKVENNIIKPILSAMRDRGNPYKGFLYIGIMVENNEPYVIEFNVRLGDTEAQVIIPLIKSSFLDIILSSINGTLNNFEVELDDKYAVTVVLAADGYPESYEKGKEISGLNNLDGDIVFHAGTDIKNGKFITNGGRVLNVVALNKNLKFAIDHAYTLASKINFDNQ